jgi:transcriptional regulator with XRE-family HTH domain
MPIERSRVPFATLGADLKRARIALGHTQKSLAEAVGCSVRYIANIENSGSIPSMPLMYDIATACKLPIEKYFYTERTSAQENPERERIALKFDICPDKYLLFIEGALDAAIKLKEADTAGE